MDPRFLRTFVTVARLGSFSGAARELGYTQSAVSQHIAILEADLGDGAAVAPAGRADRAPASGCSSTPSRSCCAWTRRAPTSRGSSAGRRRPLRIGATPLAAGFAAARVDAARGGHGARRRPRVGRARGGDGGARRGLRRRRRGGQRPAAAARARAARRRGVRGAARGRGRRATTRCSGAPSRSRTWSTRAGSTRRSSARRWTSWRRSPAPTASGPRCATTARTSRGCSRSSPRAMASRCCRSRVVADGLALGSPPLVHRTELVRIGG